PCSVGSAQSITNSSPKPISTSPPCPCSSSSSAAPRRASTIGPQPTPKAGACSHDRHSRPPHPRHDLSPEEPHLGSRPPPVHEHPDLRLGPRPRPRRGVADHSRHLLDHLLLRFGRPHVQRRIAGTTVVLRRRRRPSDEPHFLLLAGDEPHTPGVLPRLPARRGHQRRRHLIRLRRPRSHRTGHRRLWHGRLFRLSALDLGRVPAGGRNDLLHAHAAGLRPRLLVRHRQEPLRLAHRHGFAHRPRPGAAGRCCVAQLQSRLAPAVDVAGRRAGDRTGVLGAGTVSGLRSRVVPDPAPSDLLAQPSSVSAAPASTAATATAAPMAAVVRHPMSLPTMTIEGMLSAGRATRRAPVTPAPTPNGSRVRMIGISPPVGITRSVPTIATTRTAATPSCASSP